MASGADKPWLCQQRLGERQAYKCAAVSVAGQLLPRPCALNPEAARDMAGWLFLNANALRLGVLLPCFWSQCWSR